MNEPFCIRYKILLIKEELKYLEWCQTNL
jgi:hypothetical protein